MISKNQPDSRRKRESLASDKHADGKLSQKATQRQLDSSAMLQAQKASDPAARRKDVRRPSDSGEAENWKDDSERLDLERRGPPLGVCMLLACCPAARGLRSA